MATEVKNIPAEEQWSGLIESTKPNMAGPDWAREEVMEDEVREGEIRGAKEDKLIQKWRIYLFITNITEMYYRNPPPLHLINKDC